MTPQAPAPKNARQNGRPRLAVVDPATVRGPSVAAPREPQRPAPAKLPPQAPRPQPPPPQPPRRPRAPEPPRRIDRTRAHARRHSIFVALMKGLLPSLVVCLVIAFILYTRGGFEPALPEGFEFDPGQFDLSGGGVRMLNPKLTGTDRDNQHFEVTATLAIQDIENPGLITMETIRGRMRMADGGWVRVDADGGAFNSDESLLTLEDGIEVTMSTGYVARLNGARVDFNEGRVDTDNPVLVFMNAGIVSGNAMTIFDKGERVRFTGGASMTINGDPGDGEDAQ